MLDSKQKRFGTYNFQEKPENKELQLSEEQAERLHKGVEEAVTEHVGEV